MSQFLLKVLLSRGATVLYAVVMIGIPLWLLILYRAHIDGVLTLYTGILFGILSIVASIVVALLMWYAAIRPTMTGIGLDDARQRIPSDEKAATELPDVHVETNERAIVALSGVTSTLRDRIRVAVVVVFGSWWRAARTLGLSMLLVVPVLGLLHVNERQLTAIAWVGLVILAGMPSIVLVAWLSHAMKYPSRSGKEWHWMVLSAGGIGFGDDQGAAEENIRVRWTDFDRISEGRKDFYFWQDEKLVLALPKRRLMYPGAVDVVRTILKKSGLWKP